MLAKRPLANDEDPFQPAIAGLFRDFPALRAESEKLDTRVEKNRLRCGNKLPELPGQRNKPPQAWPILATTQRAAVTLRSARIRPATPLVCQRWDS